MNLNVAMLLFNKNCFNGLFISFSFIYTRLEQRIELFRTDFLTFLLRKLPFCKRHDLALADFKSDKFEQSSIFWGFFKYGGAFYFVPEKKIGRDQINMALRCGESTTTRGYNEAIGVSSFEDLFALQMKM